MVGSSPGGYREDRHLGHDQYRARLHQGSRMVSISGREVVDYLAEEDNSGVVGDIYLRTGAQALLCLFGRRPVLRMLSGSGCSSSQGDRYLRYPGNRYYSLGKYAIMTSTA